MWISAAAKIIGTICRIKKNCEFIVYISSNTVLTDLRIKITCYGRIPLICLMPSFFFIDQVCLKHFAGYHSQQLPGKR